MDNLYEIHCHTSEVSLCGYVDGKTVVEEHKRIGLNGICVTNHYAKEYFDIYDGKSYLDYANFFLDGYKVAKEHGDKIGLNVMLGMELRTIDSLNDYLVYGITEEFILKNPNMFEMTIEQFVDYTKNEDMVIVWAHPFRNNMTMIEHRILKAVETLNGNLRPDSRNYLTKKLAEENNLIGTCGSDYHRLEDLGLSVMNFDYEIVNEKALVKAILNKDFRHKELGVR